MKTNAHLMNLSNTPIPVSYENAKYKRLLKKWINRDTLIQSNPIALPADISTWGEFPIISKLNTSVSSDYYNENQQGETNY